MHKETPMDFSPSSPPPPPPQSQNSNSQSASSPTSTSPTSTTVNSSTTSKLLAQAAAYVPLVPLEAEKALLGCLLMDEGLCQEYSQVLQPDDFGDARNLYLMRVIKTMMVGGIFPDLATIMFYMGGPGKLAGMGGMEHLTDLYDSLSHVRRAPNYAEVVRQAAGVRRIGEVGASLMNLANVLSVDKNGLTDMVSQAESMIMGLGDARIVSHSSDMAELCDRFVAKIEELELNPNGSWGIPTGLTRFTNMIRGIKAPDFIIVAARPSAGKTTLIGNIAAHVSAIENEPVILFSMEMNRDQIFYRLAVEAFQASRVDIEKGQFSAEKNAFIAEAMERMRSSPMLVNDKARVSPAYIRSETLRYQARIGRPVKLVVVDYLQRMEGDGRRNENRVQELSQIAIDMKTLASELNVCVMAAAQVGRQVETRENKRPMMSDLKDCGAIEQEADVVAFIYRESYYAMKDLSDEERKVREQSQEEVEVIFEKNRDGSAGTIKLGYTAALSSFADLPEDFEAGFDGPTPF